MKRAALYVRVSTQEQKIYGLSVDNQISALTDYCEQNDIEIYDIYNDAGKSAHASYLKRKELLRLISDTNQNKVDIILFTRLDRWFRSLEDYYAVMAQIPDNVPWKTIWEDYETVTSAGRFKVNIMLSIAQAEAERTAERTKATIEYKRQRGDYVGKAPIGYKISNGKLIKDPATREAVENIFKTYLSTFSSRKACQSAKEHGLPMERQHLIKLLHRTAYYGDASGYACEPYISVEEWQTIQDNMAKYRRSPKGDRVYLFSGLCSCGYCGQRMSGHSTKRVHAGNQVVYYPNYRCSSAVGSRRACPNLQIQEPHIEKYLLNNVEALLSAYKHDIGEIVDTSDVSALIKRREALNDKLKRLSTLYADGDISLEDYRAKRDATKEELNSIKISKTELPDLPEGWKEIYEDLDPAHRQMFWRKIIKDIRITNENKTSPEVIFL